MKRPADILYFVHASPWKAYSPPYLDFTTIIQQFFMQVYVLSQFLPELFQLAYPKKNTMALPPPVNTPLDTVTTCSTSSRSSLVVTLCGRMVQYGTRKNKCIFAVVP
jgi:hypothetical protein